MHVLISNPYETCSACQGSGMYYSGEYLGTCSWCKGDTVVRRRDKKGRFTTVKEWVELDGK